MLLLTLLEYVFIKGRGLWLLFMVISPLAIAQQKEDRYYRITDNENIQKYCPSLDTTYFKNTNLVNNELSDCISILHRNGFFRAKINRRQVSDDSVLLSVEKGPRYRWSLLNIDSLPEQLKGNIKSKRQSGHIFHYSKLNAFFDKIISFYENRGYPFAKIRFTNFSWNDSLVSATLNIDSGRYISFGNIKYKQHVSVKKSFLGAYLKINSGAPYKEEIAASVEERIRNLSWLELNAPVKWKFQHGKAIPVLDLKIVTSNQFSALVGLTNTGENNELVWVGEANLLLRNLFKGGQKLDLFWEKLPGQSQKLNIGYAHPNLMASKWDIEVNFDLYKQDTSFLNQNFEAALRWPVTPNISGALLVEFAGSRNFLSQDVSNHPQGQAGNSSGTYYGTGWQMNLLNDVLRPTKGYLLKASLKAGKKAMELKADKNSNALRDSSVLIFKGHVNFTQYYNPLNRLVLYHKLEGGYMPGQANLINDLYRVGGFKSIRGFREDRFYANNYAISQMEARWLLESSKSNFSYFYIFGDTAWLIKQTLNNKETNFVLGTGAGLSMQTRNGIFSVAYGIGKTGNNTFNVGDGLLHLGYINRF